MTQVQNSSGYEQTISKNSVPIIIQRATYEIKESGDDFTHTYGGYYNIMGSEYEMSLGVSKASNLYSTSVKVLENSREALFISSATNVHQGRNHFDVATETRSDYMPDYNTNFELAFEKTDTNVELTSTFYLDDVELVRMLK